MVDLMVIGARGIPDVEGGAEKHAEAVFPLLAARGYTIEVVGMRHFIKAREYKGVRLKGVPTLSFANTDKLIYQFLAFLYAVARRPKLVHLQGLNSALFLILYKLCGLKVVVRYGSADHQHSKWGLVGRVGFRLCELQIRFADHIIAVSKKYKEVLGQRYGLKDIEVVPNGVDAPVVSAEAAAYLTGLGLQQKRYVLAVGRLTADKDYETLIAAFEQLNDPDLCLVIAGGASEKGYAERLFAAQSDRIRFVGRVERRLLSGLYAGCAVYVNSSLHEGLSNAVLEAISHGRAIIVSAIPANREMGLAPDCYFAVGDAAALADRLRAALADPGKFLADANKFADWPSVMARMEAVYRKVLPELGNDLGVRAATLERATAARAGTQLQQASMSPSGPGV